MANFFKHVGTHRNKKVVIVQRQIPTEEHMCSVIYTEIIPSKYHDDIMQVLESPEGQAENDFWKVLRRRTSYDGVPLLDAIAREGFLKKAATNEVIVRPNSSSNVRLDELNQILEQVGRGDHARKELERLENESGYKNPEQTRQTVQESAPVPKTNDGVLDDSALAKINIEQAENMKAQASQLEAEAQRLMNEAYELDPSLAPQKTKRKSRATTKKSNEQAA